MSDNGHGDGWRTQPLYTIREAAQLAHVSSPTIRRWLYGYAPDPRYPSFKTLPVFGEKDATSPYVSFLQLIEIVIAREFRKAGRVKLDVVRQAHENARNEWGIEYPFAHRELESLGGHVIEWIRGNGGIEARAVDQPEQWAIPGIIEERISELDYERMLAARWYPAGRAVQVVVDPLFSTGLPTIVGRGVTVGTIYRRWKTDQTIEFIAEDLQIEPAQVERALKYADKVKIAA